MNGDLQSPALAGATPRQRVRSLTGAVLTAAVIGLTYLGIHHALRARLSEQAEVRLFPDRTVRSLAFSSDGTWLASGSRNGTVRLWRTKAFPRVGPGPWYEDGQTALAILTEHRDSVTCLAFSPDGRTLASAGWDKRIGLWDVKPKWLGPELRSLLTGHTDFINSLAFSPDGRTLVSGSDDGTIRLWDVAAGVERHRLGDGKEPVLCLAFRPDGKLLAFCSRENGTVQLWDLNTGEHSVTAVPVGTHAVAFAPDGQAVAGAEADGTVRVWDLAANEKRATLVRQRLGSDPRLVFAPDGKRLVVAHLGGVLVWDTSTNTVVRAVGNTDGHDPAGLDGTAVAVSPYWGTFAAGLSPVSDPDGGRSTVGLWALPPP